MVERWPDGSNAWQDGDVLTASDLNDTVDGVTDAIDTIGEEATENRYLLNKIQFQTSADPDGDSENILVDIATDISGYRDYLNTNKIAQFKAGTLDGFHVEKEDIEYSSYVTTNTVSNNIDTRNTTYHPIYDKIFKVDGISTSASETTLNYEIINTDGTIHSSGSFTIPVEDFTTVVREPEACIDSGVAMILKDTTESIEPNKIIAFDMESESLIDTGGVAVGTGDEIFNISGVRNQGNESSGLYGNDDADDYDVFTISDTSIDVASPLADAVPGIDSRIFILDLVNQRSMFSLFAGTNDYLAAYDFVNNNASLNDKNHQITSPNFTAGFLNNKYYFQEVNSEDAFERDLNNLGATDFFNSQQLNFDKNVTASQDFIVLFDSNNTLFVNITDGYLNISSTNYYSDSLKNSFVGTNPNSNNVDEFIIDDDNGKAHLIFKSSSDIQYHSIDLNDGLIADADYTWETVELTHKNTIEYVNADFRTIGNSQTQYQIRDTTNNQDLGPYNSGEKIYIGDEGTSSIKIQVPSSLKQENTGIKNVNVLVW